MSNSSKGWHGNRLRPEPEAYQEKKNRVKREYRKSQTKLDKLWPNRYAIKKLIAKYGQFQEVPTVDLLELYFDPNIYEAEVIINGQVFFSVGKGYYFSYSKNKKLLLCKI